MAGVKGVPINRPTNQRATRAEQDSCSLLNETRAFLSGLPRGGISEVSKATGISFSTLNKLADGRYFDASVRNVEKILLFKRARTAALPKSGNHRSLLRELVK